KIAPTIEASRAAFGRSQNMRAEQDPLRAAGEERMRLLWIAVTAVAAALAGPAAGEQWPARNVRLIVPYPAGGNVDTAARIIADKLQERLGQPFVIENKAGAGGLIAGEAFAKSANDGYTLFVGANGPVLFAPEISKRDAYNWKRDFLPITTVSMASPGAGTTNHLLSELVQSSLGLQWVTSHYRGNAPATNDLIGGQVQFAFDQISVALQYFKSGMLRPLAVTSASRLASLPDVPT